MESIIIPIRPLIKYSALSAPPPCRDQGTSRVQVYPFEHV